MQIINITPDQLTRKSIDNLLDRTAESTAHIESQVNDILENVRNEGDAALINYTEQFDGVRIETLKVSESEINQAYETVEASLLSVFEEAAENIRNFHQLQKPKSWIKEMRPGVKLGQRYTPIDRAGLYVPGGKAGYPSTVLMDAIPAKVAGVSNLSMVTPPRKDGSIDPVILACAKIVGVDDVYRVGGAQAIAALAYGTETIKPVDTIVGPGNIYVATAKKQVYGTVSIDMIAGPSEIAILSDGSSDPNHIAADLLAQAEHDELAQSILVITDEQAAQATIKAVYAQIENSPRGHIMKQSIQNRGRIFIVKDMDMGVDLMNLIAPEHLEILCKDPDDYVDRLLHAGALFVGPYTPEPIGDYFAGPNHTLPTSGTARYASPLGVQNFMKFSSYLKYDSNALHKDADSVIAFAESEGLYGHANAVKVRVK